MTDKKTSHLINQLKNGQELSAEERWHTIKLLQNIEEYKVKEKLLESLAKINKVSVNCEHWAHLLQECFSKIGEGIEAEGIIYYEEFTDDETGQTGMVKRVEWQRDQSGEVNQKKKRSFLSSHQFNDLFSSLEKNEPVQIARSESLKKAVKDLLVEDDLSSILMLPIIVKNRFFGLLRFDDNRQRKKWKKPQISLLQTVAFQVRNLIEKREMDKQLHNTLRQARIGVWEMDLENDSYYWSPNAKEIFELDQDIQPSIDVTKQLIKHKESLKKVTNSVKEILDSGKPYDLEFPIITGKGNEKWISDTGQAEFRNGKCVRLYGMVQDIHDRKKAELESKKNKQLLEAITQETDVAVWVRDHQGKIIFVNNEWKRIFGLDDRQLTGNSVYDLFDKKDAAEIVNSDKTVIETGRQEFFEEQIKTVDGYRHFMVNKFPLTGIEGLNDAAGGIGTDITKIKKTEERLQATEQKLREVVEHSTNLFYTHDVNNTLTYLSPQSEKFLGYKPDEAILKWTEFVTDHPQNKKGVKATETAINTGKPQPPFELQLKKGNAEIIWVEVNEAPVVIDGETVSVAGSLTDITERKKAQEAIRASLKEKETLLAEIHHRVKNNLAVVASLMQLQALETENPELQEQLLESVLRIKSMASIHEHLYQNENFSKLDFGHNLRSLISDIIDTMQYSTKIEVSYECDDVFLNVNQAIPGSLIVNEVITNIIKHGFIKRETGVIRVNLSKKDKQVSLMIEDDGRGFSKDFDLNTTNTLGMQLIKTLSEQLDGSYNFIRLEPGSGFELTFEASDKQ